MAKKDKDKEIEETTEAGPEPEVKVEVVKSASASVYTSRGQFVRTYTKSIHGSKFDDLAKEYAGKIGGTVR